MSFAADALGFYLQIEDELTPTLDSAAKAYRKFVRSIEKSNKAAYKAASSGLGSLAHLAEAFEDLPRRAVTGYKDALTALRSRIKPINQPINLVFNAASKKAIGDAVGQTVAKALAGTKIRLGATFPSTLIKYFDQSKTLRGLYQDVPQPPDMVGKLEPKKFKEGGLVEGGKPGKDSVLSLLEPGEFVLPKDFVDKVGKLRNQAGQFVSPKIYTESLARLENLGKAMGKLRVAVDAGFATNEKYEDGLREMQAEMFALTKSTSSLTYQQQVRLSPAIAGVRKEMEGLTSEMKDTGKVANNLLSKVLGPARFIAVSMAAEKIVESLGNLKDGGLQAFDALGGGQIESFTTNMNQMNTRLNKSRAELRVFKREAADVADLKDLNINEMSEALEGMVLAGEKDTKMLLKLAPAATDFARASMVNFDTSAQAAVRLARVYGFTEDQIAGTFDNIRMFQKDGVASAEDLTNRMIENEKALGPALLRESTETRQAMLSNLARADAAFAAARADDTGALTGMLARAMGGGIDEMEKVGTLLRKSVPEVTAAFQSGNLTGLFDELALDIQQLVSTNNLQGLDRLREAVGFEGTATEFGQWGVKIKDVNAKLDELGAKQHTLKSMGTAQARLNETADATRTTYERLAKDFGQFAANSIPDLLKKIPAVNVLFGESIDGMVQKFPLLETTFGDVIDLGQEFNATTLLSIGYLGKLAVQAGVGTVKGLLAGASAMASWVKGMKIFGGATKAAAAAEAASTAVKGAATSGLFAGFAAGLKVLAGGLTTFGTAMLGPGGVGLAALAGTVLAVGGALYLATPALAEFGKVVIAAIPAAVQAFGMFVPVLLKVADVVGNVLLGAIDGVVTVFQGLFNADVSQLVLMGPALFAVAGGLGAIALASASLAAVQFGQGILSFFTGGSADAGSGVFGLLASMIGSMRNLKVATPDAVRDLTASVNNLGGFVIAYTGLLDRLGSMPSEDVTPRLRNLADAITQTTRATGLQQTRTTGAVAPSQLQALVDAILNNPVMDQVAAATVRTNELLAQILAALQQGPARQPVPVASPAPSASGPSAGPSAFTSDIAAFGY